MSYSKYSSLLEPNRQITVEGVTIFNVKKNEILCDATNKIRHVEIGNPSKYATEKIIMLVGATGSGKTTLVDGMLNYIFGVEWKDSFRLKTTTDDLEGHGQNQAQSQTKWITVYTIHHQEWMSVPFTLTIIDTPGFGDTSGIQGDREISQQIGTFFSRKDNQMVDHIDAIGVVAQSSLQKLTQTQSYIFDSILALFGKEVASNIFLLLTFSDGHKPKILKSMEDSNYPFVKYLKFNNSALFSSNREHAENDDDTPDTESVEEIFVDTLWKMGMKSFEKFLKCIGEVSSQGLFSSKEVLEERNTLDITVDCFQNNIHVAQNTLASMGEIAENLLNHQGDIDANQNFTYTVDTTEIVTIPTEPGQYTTNCTMCKKTCCDDCSIMDDQLKKDCMVMEDGACTKCETKCKWNLHKNQPYVYTVFSGKRTRTDLDVMERYDQATAKKMVAEETLNNLAKQFTKIQLILLQHGEQVRRSLRMLEDKALKMNPLSTIDYIDILLQSELSEARPGWPQRIKQLEDAKKQAQQLHKMAAREHDYFRDYQRKYEEEVKENKIGVWSTVTKYLRFDLMLTPHDIGQMLTNLEETEDTADHGEDEMTITSFRADRPLEEGKEGEGILGKPDMTPEQSTKHETETEVDSTIIKSNSKSDIV